MEGADSRKLHSEGLAWESEAEIVATLLSRPGSLVAALPSVERLAQALAGDMIVDVLGGVVRVRAKSPPGSQQDAADALSTTRAELRDRRLELTTAPIELRKLVSKGEASGAARLSAALKTAFDPSAVLAPRCP